jgi:periplasmic protein CpxP/Spy
MTPSQPQSRRRFWTIAGVGAALAGTLALGACSHGGWHGHHGHHGTQPMDPQEMSERIDKGVRWVLDDVNATPEQKQRVAEIAKAAVADLMPLRTQHRAARERAVQLLSQPSVDRSAIEALRVEELQLAESASKRFAQALADAAEVLTPEQRTKLAERWKKRMG